MAARVRWGRRVAAGVGVAVVVVLAGGTALALEVRQVEADLRAGRAAAEEAVAAVREGDLPGAVRGFDRADRALAPLATHRASLVWRVARRVPLVSPSITLVDDLADASVAGVELAHGVTAVLGDLTEDRDDAVPLATFQRLQAALAPDAVAPLDEAVARLRRDRSGPVPSLLREARDELLATVAEFRGSLEPVRDAVAVVPALLGVDGPRRYLVAMQNSAELRGTGGLVGFHAVLTAEAGRLSMSAAAPDEAVVVPAGAVTLSAAQREWLGHAAPQANVSNVNLDPDLTRSGPLLMALYEATTGVRLDGVIAVDPVGLAALMDPGDQLALPEGVAGAADGLPATVAPGDLARVMLVDAYQVLGGDTPARKDFHAALAGAMFDRVVDLRWDRDLLDRLAFAVDGRHLQVHSTDPDLQARLERLGVGGRLAAPDGYDLLAVTANNAGGTKQDVHVRHGLDGRVVLTPTVDTPGPSGAPVPARRDVRLGVTVDNPLDVDDGWDDYVVATRVAGEGVVPALRGANRTWFTWWAPGDTRVTAGRSDDGPVQVAIGTIGGLSRVDHLLTTPAGSARSADLSLTGPVSLASTGDALTYRLTLWRQAKAVADRVRLQVTAGDGWVVTGGTVRGGDDAGRLGFGEDGQPLRLEVEDGIATVTGTAVTDVEVEVVLAPAG